MVVTVIGKVLVSSRNNAELNCPLGSSVDLPHSRTAVQCGYLREFLLVAQIGRKVEIHKACLYVSDTLQISTHVNFNARRLGGIIRLAGFRAWFKMLSFWVTGADGERSCPAEADGWMVNPTGCASVAFEALVAE